MASYFSEVMPAVAAMILMGSVGIAFMILFETARTHWQAAAARTKAAIPAVQPPVAAQTPDRVEAVEEEAPVPELRFDGDAGMFGGDFADDEAESPESAVADPAVEPVAPEPEVQTAPARDDEPEHGIADTAGEKTARRNREEKHRGREREANNERRNRKAEKSQRSDDAAGEKHRRPWKDRDAAPDEARKLRQQNRRRNSQ
ncbi:MAG TPA: hypothetical protein VMF58_18440 [Rhizomicrobium sp.]|nr:hypothetical protein [Rhizomicrobium sp.]